MHDIDWDRLSRYASGECTEAERATVESWIASSPDAAAALRAIKQVASQVELESSAQQLRERFVRLQARVDAERSLPSSRPIRWWFTAAKIAAIFAMVLGGSLLVVTMLRRPVGTTEAAEALNTVATARGQRMSLKLSDGTQVVLGPASTLRFPGSFRSARRTVELDGEAVFTVTHHAHQPFTVRTPRFEVRDLGTRFVVDAYSEDSTAQVAVAEGKVAVARDSAADSVVLSPRDGALIARSGHVSVTHGIAVDMYFGWTESRLMFARATLGDALRRIERWHDIEIILAVPLLADRRFNASFEHGESATDMLDVIGSLLDLQVRQDGRRKFTLTAVQ